MAFCSIAHSSGASRPALLQRAAQPGVGDAGGAAVGEGDGAGVTWGAGALALGACWASPRPAGANNINAERASGGGLKFGLPWPRGREANVQFKTPLETYICWWSFDSNIRISVRGNGIRMLESDH